MSYGPTEQPADTEDSRFRAERLIEEMANGLHAMAQPLTILRGTLWTLTLQSEKSAEYSRYLELSNQELERVCDLMTGMQKLFDAHQSAAACTKFDVCEVATTLAGNLNASMQKSRQTLLLEKPKVPIYAVGDPSRTEYALQIAIKTSAAISSAGDTIKMMILPRDGQVALVVRNITSGGKKLGSFERFFLFLTQTSIESQSGTYECVPHPLSVTLTLPAYLPGAVTTEAASISSENRK